MVVAGVLLASIMRESPRLREPSAETEDKVVRPAFVKLDPAQLRTAPLASTHVERPSILTPPTAPQPMAALSDIAFPALSELPTLPVVPASKAVATARTGSPQEPGTSTATAGPASLTMGQGEGRQPWPDYPPESLRRRESGAVRVRFSVLPAGEVAEARVAESSGWPGLDRAATAVILRRWRFPAGEPREYEVTIQFQIR